MSPMSEDTIRYISVRGKAAPNDNMRRIYLESFKDIDQSLCIWLESYWGSPECVW